jgi:hypothetical protein
MVGDGRAPGAVAHGLVTQSAMPPLTDPGTVDPAAVLPATYQGAAAGALLNQGATAGAQVDNESSAPALDSAPPTFDSAPATFESAPPLRAPILGASVGVQTAEGAAWTDLDAEQAAQHAAVAGLHALAVAHGLSPATVAAVAAAGLDAVATALRILGARTGPGSLDSAAAALAPVFADSAGLRTGTGGPGSTSATASAAVGHSPGMGAMLGHGVGAMGAGGAPLFLGLLPLNGLGMPPATTPFSATAFLRGVSPRPSTITAANSALAAALETAKAEAAAAEERVCGRPRLGARARHL